MNVSPLKLAKVYSIWLTNSEYLGKHWMQSIN